jgi:hypothetical protein
MSNPLRFLEPPGRLAQGLAWVPVAHLAAVAVAGSLRQPAPPTARRDRRWVVLICAHDEAGIVAGVVRSAAALEPSDGAARVIVVADNCSDDTAGVARAAGAEVWERKDPEHPGKGHALHTSITRLLTEPGWDALLVLDADAIVSPDFLRVMDARLEAGAEVVQAERRVVNGDLNLLTRLTVISSSSSNILRPRARERLGLPSRLAGTGMVFSRAVLERSPWTATGLVEDVEQWLAFLRRGIRPRFETAVRCDDLMPETLAQATRQRERWAEGRKALLRQSATSALRDAVRSGDAVTAESVATELLAPTLAVTGAWVAASWALRSAGKGRIDKPGLVQMAVIGGHLAAGLRAAEASPQTWAALGMAPVAAAWKLRVVVRGRLGRLDAGWRGTRATD